MCVKETIFELYFPVKSRHVSVGPSRSDLVAFADVEKVAMCDFATQAVALPLIMRNSVFKKAEMMASVGGDPAYWHGALALSCLLIRPMQATYFFFFFVDSRHFIETVIINR